MALASEFYRLVQQWTLPNGEVANTTNHWRPAVAEGNDFDADAARLAGRSVSFWTAIKGAYTDGVAYVGAQVALISIAGITVRTLEFAVTAVPGTATDVPLPHEVAACVGLGTGGAGRSDRGRFYLPPPRSAVLTSSGRYNSDFTTLIADSSADLLAPFTAPTMTAVLYSRKNASLAPLTSLNVGDVPDAQRRRRDQLAEVRTRRDL